MFCNNKLFQLLTKLKQFSLIVLLNLDRSLDIYQLWQLSILNSIKIVLNQKLTKKFRTKKICFKLFLRKEQLI